MNASAPLSPDSVEQSKPLIVRSSKTSANLPSTSCTSRTSCWISFMCAFEMPRSTRSSLPSTSIFSRSIRSMSEYSSSRIEESVRTAHRLFCRSSNRFGFIDVLCNSSFSLMCIVELPGTFAKYTKSAFPSASEIPHSTISYRPTPCAFAFLRSMSMFCCKGSNAMYLSHPHSVSTRNCS